MRRGLLKDLANTSTQMACGYRLYADLKRLAEIGPRTIKIDLLSCACFVDEAPLDPPLNIATEVTHWMRERFVKDEIPAGFLVAATLTLKPRAQAAPNLSIECSTLIETVSETFNSDALAFWHSQDITDQ